MIGQTISHYTILDKLGEGGMGKVYLADDTKLNRKVALKFLPKEFTADQDSKKRFEREAQAAALLNHSNIITIHEIDEFQGRSYIVMEYVDGMSLKQRIENFKETPADLKKIRDIIIIAIQICRGLEKAHEAEIIHRDIKPGNILIDSDDQVKIMDFGLAKLMGASKLTQDSYTLGTALYMSPEHIEGKEIDSQADIWSFGVVLYEMITGEVPFKAEYWQSLFYSIMNEAPIPISDLCEQIPVELEEIVNKCLKKDVNHRYSTISEVLSELKMLKHNLDSEMDVVRIKKTRKLYTKVRQVGKMAAPLVFLVIVLLIILIPNPGREALKEWLGSGKIPDQKHLVVLPINNPGKNPLNQAYRVGTAERIISKLNSLEQFEEQLWVAPSSELRRHDVTSVKKVISSFKTTLILTVSVEFDGDTLTHTLSLVNSETQKALKTRVVTNHVTNLSGLQDGIIEGIVEMLDIQLTPAIEGALTAGGTSLPGAYRLYLQGLGFLQESKNKQSITQSINMFHQAIEQDDSYDEAYASLGRACFIMYRLTKEKNWLEKAESFCNRAMEINKRLYPVHITLGFIHKKEGDYDQAIKELQKALDLNPESFRACLWRANIFYFNLRNQNRAEEEYETAIKIRTDYWEGYILLAYLYYSSGRLLEAEEKLYKVIDLNPAEIWAYNTLIAIYHKRGDAISVQKAREIFEKSKKIGPSSDTYTYMGNHLFYFQKRYKKARDMYKKAIEVGENNPNIFALWGNLADSYRLMGGHEQEAKKVYQKAVQLVQQKLSKKPDDASMRSSLALYLSKLGESNQAILEINRALKMGPNDLKVIETSVIVFELSGQRKKALHSLEEFIKRHGAMGELSRNPFLSELRRDPQYLKLVKPKNSSEIKKKEGNQ